jgi:hypothetical protein
VRTQKLEAALGKASYDVRHGEFAWFSVEDCLLEQSREADRLHLRAEHVARPAEYSQRREQQPRVDDRCLGAGERDHEVSS